jgi:hypothetical protein
MKYWKRFVCWCKGHDLFFSGNYGTFGAQIYRCRRCEKTTMQYYDDTQNFFERNDEFISVIKVAFMLLMLFALVAGCTTGISYADCKYAGNNMSLEYKYDFWAGCFYNVDGRWIDDDMLIFNYEDGTWDNQ